MKEAIKIVLLAGLGLVIALLFAGTFYMGMRYAQSQTASEQLKYKMTGENLFEAINSHRASNNLNPVELDDNLCDNLVERWLAIKNPENGHKGFEEWLESNDLHTGNKYIRIGEVYVVDTYTPEDAIKFWLSSPGHKGMIETKDLKYGCTYAHDGTGVAVLAR